MAKIRKIHVAVIMGGPSSEHTVSLNTGANILRALDKTRYVPIPILITKKGEWVLPKRKVSDAGTALSFLISKFHIDVAYIALHGKYGEDGVIQGFLEAAYIPYTGSGVQASALAIDKERSNQIYSTLGLLVPKYVVYTKKEASRAKKEIKKLIGFPCVVKPIHGGSSVGTSIVKDPSKLPRALKWAFLGDTRIMVQRFIKGREVTCGVLDEFGKKPCALPPTEIIPISSEFFDYSAKYTPNATKEVTPAQFSKNQNRKIQDVALRAHQAIGCIGLSRSDMIVAGKKIYILETNTLPGMTATSLFPQAAQAVGISPSRLADILIQSALKKR